jgi:hypothetical protein
LHGINTSTPYASGNGSPSKESPDLATAKPSEAGEDGYQEASWWGSSAYEDTQTPTVTSFHRVEENAVGMSSDGFISLMDDPTYSATPSPPPPQSYAREDDEEDVEDLGFSNSRPKIKPQQESDDNKPEPQPSVTKSATPSTTSAPG